MNKVDYTISEDARKYLNEAIDFLNSQDIVEMKNSYFENAKNKNNKVKLENEFDHNFIKSYVGTKIKTIHKIKIRVRVF